MYGSACAAGCAACMQRVYGLLCCNDAVPPHISNGVVTHAVQTSSPPEFGLAAAANTTASGSDPDVSGSGCVST